MAARGKPAGPVVLGIEGGGTRTSVMLVEGPRRVLTQFQMGPAVLPLMSDRELIWHLREIHSQLPRRPCAVCAGLAGVRAAADRERLKRAASRVWPATPFVATDDLEVALMAATPAADARAQVLVLSGTGSCCFGRNVSGATAKVGGRGHIIGDRGSACDIGMRGLRGAIAEFDRTNRMGRLGTLILHSLTFNEPEQLIPWSIDAKKGEIASLCLAVFTAARQGDPMARQILRDAAEMLAEDGCVCAGKLAAANERVQFVFNGGVLLKNPAFLADVTRRIRKVFPLAQAGALDQASVWGAVKIAQSLAALGRSPLPATESEAHRAAHILPDAIADFSVLARSPTERRNPRSLRMHELSLDEGIELMLGEDARIPAAIRGEKKQIKKIIAQTIRAFEQGGRLFYAGAGTSGRLGVLDASEIPPTFRAPREQVQGIIAGGRQALWSAVEGAEDDVFAGALAVRNRGLGPKDVLIGIAASGRTPFVWGAIREANQAGAFTALLCFNPAMRDVLASGSGEIRPWKPRVIVVPKVGPEVLTGSTRLKAGTATKLILNMITTLAMTRVGKVISNLMVDLNPSNTKLRDRAARIIRELTGCPIEEAQDALRHTGWVVKDAYEKIMKRRKRKRHVHGR